jgi:alkylation response protein AidB-like acyl-CoA dehydrogenase
VEGISLFLVDRDVDRVNVQRTQVLDGRNAAIIAFTNVEVSADALLGEQNKGFAALSATLDAGNAHIAAELLGIAQESFDRTLHYMKERK